MMLSKCVICYFCQSIRPQKWLFRLEEPRTGEQYGFTDLEALTAFLRERLKEADSNSQIKA